MFAALDPQIAVLIVAAATLITAIGGVIAILLQDRRQHASNQQASSTKIDEAVSLLAEGHAVLANKIDAQAATSEVLFGMVVNVDKKVTTLANRRPPAEHRVMVAG